MLKLGKKKKMEWSIERQIYRQMDRRTNGQTHKGQMGIRTNGQIDIRTNRQAGLHCSRGAVFFLCNPFHAMTQFWKKNWIFFSQTTIIWFTAINQRKRQIIMAFFMHFDINFCSWTKCGKKCSAKSSETWSTFKIVVHSELENSRNVT